MPIRRAVLARVTAAGGALAIVVACAPPPPPVRPEVPESDPDSTWHDAPHKDVNCNTVRTPVEPDLIGLDASARASLDSQRHEGVFVVRYRGHGCDVRFDILPSCTAAGSYAFMPYSATESKVAHGDAELYAEFPLAASRLASRVTGESALRADVMLVGIEAIKAPRTYRVEDLQGDCQGATHVVTKIYVGGFAMATGNARGLEARPSLFRGGSTSDDAVILQREGSAKACEEAQEKGAFNPACDVPLRLALLPIPVACDSDSGKCGTVAEALPLGDASAPLASAPRTGDGGAEPAPGGMVHIPGGTFTMGARSRVDLKNDPARRTVTVAAFDLDVTEVTVSDYTACVDQSLCPAAPTDQPTCNYGHADRANHPMNCIDWNQAWAYCHAQGKRLPTEEEWEFAARGGPEERTYPWGVSEPSRQLCWSGITKRDGTCPVRTFAAGAYGLYDMAGNVSEWSSSPYSADRKDARVCRGGGWSDARALDFRGAYRDAHAPSNRDSDLGVRCAR